jgi:hypothetical protein
MYNAISKEWNDCNKEFDSNKKFDSNKDKEAHFQTTNKQSKYRPDNEPFVLDKFPVQIAKTKQISEAVLHS